MQLTVFGASRGVGRASVDAALAAGHRVTAMARNVAALGATDARVVAADVADAAAVARAIDGSDAVIVALGTKPGDRPADVCSRGTRTILAAMGVAGVRRMVVVTSYGVGETRDRRPFPFNLIAATLLRDVMADKEIQEREVRASATQWTIVQPLGLTDAPATGAPYVATDRSRRSTRVARADVAAVCVDAIDRGAYIGACVAVSGA